MNVENEDRKDARPRFYKLMDSENGKLWVRF